MGLVSGVLKMNGLARETNNRGNWSLIEAQTLVWHCHRGTASSRRR
jgi:hypothetical protein